MPSSPSNIAKIEVEPVDSNGKVLENEKVAVESFWKDSSSVIVFFRRFGWQFCRLAASEFSEKVKPTLDANNIRLIGIGFDKRFVQPFVEGGFFTGELYVDPNKECYNALQYQVFSYWDLAKKILSGKWRAAKAEGDKKKIASDLKGDAFQNGGTLIVSQGGKSLYEYRQEDAADHLPADKIFKALKLTPITSTTTPEETN